MDPFLIKQHDTAPSLAAVLSEDGEPIAIPPGAAVVFVMRPRSRGCQAAAPALERAAVVVNGGAGAVRYDWAVGDTAAAGVYDAEFKLSVAGMITTYPSAGYIPVTVVKDLS